MPAKYYNIPFDEIYSDDWKEKALEEYAKKKHQQIAEENLAKEKALAETEARERAELKRLKAKYE